MPIHWTVISVIVALVAGIICGFNLAIKSLYLDQEKLQKLCVKAETLPLRPDNEKARFCSTESYRASKTAEAERRPKGRLE